jgi:hypothetical protein
VPPHTFLKTNGWFESGPEPSCARWGTRFRASKASNGTTTSTKKADALGRLAKLIDQIVNPLDRYKFGARQPETEI